jgi:glycosyltransferase involved in cell wall biosynthesis
MPLPILAPPGAAHGRRHFGLPEESYLFLFTFDVSSQLGRKNPLGLVRAFRRAFPSPQGVALVLKLTNAEYDRAAVRVLQDEAAEAGATLLAGYMSREELGSLMHCADCYVSLHRSEGYGIGIAEALALGKPVIATGYSGNADLMTPENSYPVNYRLVPVDRDHGPYLRGYRWAEPDLEHAAALMRQVAGNRAESAARGRLAARQIADTRTAAVTGARARKRLEEIRSGSAAGTGTRGKHALP